MHRSSRVPCVVLAIAFFAAIGPASAQAQVSPPPFRPGEVLPDTSGVAVNAHGPGFLFDHDTYYWFGEVMTPGEQGNQPHVGVSCYSSKVLYYWKNLGVVLDQKHPVNDLTETSVVERPKVLFNRSTRQYVMWFHLEQTNHAIYGKAALVGVAVSKHPAGPYKYLRSFRPDGEESRDMTLFQDDDGKAYTKHKVRSVPLHALRHCHDGTDIATRSLMLSFRPRMLRARAFPGRRAGRDRSDDAPRGGHSGGELVSKHAKAVSRRGHGAHANRQD